MEEHVKRMVQEYEELDERKEKLGRFISQNPIYKSLPIDKQQLMQCQYDAMSLYSYFLAERIKLEES